MKLYRVENTKEGKGLWRDFDGTWNPKFNSLTDGKCRNLPMEDNDIYREGNKKWFASAPSKETLKEWFSKKDLEELHDMGFDILEFDSSNCKKLSDFEYIFTRDSVSNLKVLGINDIYNEGDEGDEENDNVNHPQHYTSHPSGIECIEITRHYCFSVGNAIKYLWRAGLKKDAALEDRQKEIEDLEKAIWYIKDRINQLKEMKV